MISPFEDMRRAIVKGFGGVAALSLLPKSVRAQTMSNDNHADMIVHNGRFTSLDRANPNVSAVAIRDGLFVAAGDEVAIMAHRGPATQLIDVGRRRVIPGLNDSHTHLIRGGLNYNLELRWDGVKSLADAMATLKAQAAITPPPQWVRIIGGFTEHQFVEKRLPTLDEVNAVAPETPVFILHLYDRALLNKAALRAVGYTKDTPNPPGGEIQRDASGNPTGLLIARPNATILYATLAKGPKLDPEDQINSTRHYMRELNRLGITSVIDAGGGFQNYPDDYAIIAKLAQNDQLTVRIAYNLFNQSKGKELEDFQAWTKLVRPGQGTPMYRHNGAGEMLVFSAADFEDFREPRPNLSETLEEELFGVTQHLVENRWPFRIHGTYEESISRFLDVFERVNREVPFDGLHWIIDHAETISPRSIDRIKALGGGIAVQHRMAYQGEYFAERYGTRAAEATPPVKQMLAAGVPVGMGTDATRVASYNPWVGLAWLVTGETVGGMTLTPTRNRLDRETALRLYTEGSSWFSTENGKKGAIKVGQYADIAVLTHDYMEVPESEIADLASALTIVGGKVVHGSDDFSTLAPPLPPPSPDWAPTRRHGGYQHGANPLSVARVDAAVARSVTSCCVSACSVHGHNHARAYTSSVPASDLRSFWGALGCACFSF
jgi:predicted amidohydrolase YtcJ